MVSGLFHVPYSLRVSFVLRLDSSASFKALPRTTQGGLIIPAALTRTGVFTYYRDDGTPVRELRHPDEVFSAKSLATLRSAPITIGHPLEGINPGNWASRAVGHVDAEGKADGTYVSGDVRILDERAIKGIESGALQELSCGYGCRVDMTPGEYNGEAYDGRQVDIVYNHVALLPKGGGRAGRDVRLRLDGAGNQLTEEAPGTLTVSPLTLSPRTDSQTMTPEQIAALQKDLADAKALAAAEKVRADAAEVLIADKSASEVAAAKEEVLKAAAKELQVKLDAATDPKALDAKVNARVALVGEARTVLDAKDAPYKAEGKTDHQVRVEVLGRLSPAFKCDGKSEAAVEGAYALALEMSATSRKAMSSVQGSTPAGGVKVKADSTDAVVSAYEKNKTDGVQAHVTGPSTRISRK